MPAVRYRFCAQQPQCSGRIDPGTLLRAIMAASECERTCRKLSSVATGRFSYLYKTAQYHRMGALSHERAVRNAPGTECRCADAGRRDPACERVSTQCRWAVSRADDIRAIWEGRAATGIHAGGLGPTEHDLSGDSDSFILQAPRLRAAGPRDVGPGRIHSYQRGLPWSWQVAGSTRSEFSYGISRLLRCHWMGGYAALEQRESRVARYFLLRRGAMVCGRDAAAASCGNSALAGHIRLLSRPHAAGRHLRERISQTLVEPQRPTQPTRQSGYRLSGHLHRRTCDGAGQPLASGARDEPCGLPR